MSQNEEMSSTKIVVLIVSAVVMVIVMFLCLCFGVGALSAKYRLWKMELTGQTYKLERTYRGEAIAAEAEFAKQARVSAAQAEFNSAQLTADAIEIVGKAAQMYPEYRQQEFMVSMGEALKEGNISQVIYLPTEAGVPIMEAGKRGER